MKFSDARIKFYEAVQAYHKSVGLDPRFHRSALEGYFKEMGGDPWSLTEEDHAQYKAWRLGKAKAFAIPE